jgi:hypothetical protein
MFEISSLQLSKEFQTLGSHLTLMLGEYGHLERQIGIGIKLSKENRNN